MYSWDRYFAGTNADLNSEQVAAIVCREMKWTYEEYQNTPATFIDIVLLMLKAENKAQSKNK